MSKDEIARDERTVAMENAGYRWSYLVLSFGLLILTAYRSLARGEASWELLALVLLGGVVNAIYQGTRRVLNKQWIATTVTTVGIAALVAIILLVAKLAR
jgi:hypothetical protein